MDRKRCASCGRAFRPRPQVPHQVFCAAPDCQRERRRRWQHAKRRSDSDYLENEVNARRDWAARNTDYWRHYRQAHPDYVARNRRQQRDRNARLPSGRIANGDASPSKAHVPSGIYRLTPLAAPGIANGDVWMAKITLISRRGTPAPRLQREDLMGFAAAAW